MCACACVHMHTCDPIELPCVHVHVHVHVHMHTCDDPIEPPDACRLIVTSGRDRLTVHVDAEDEV